MSDDHLFSLYFCKIPTTDRMYNNHLKISLPSSGFIRIWSLFPVAPKWCVLTITHDSRFVLSAIGSLCIYKNIYKATRTKLSGRRMQVSTPVHTRCICIPQIPPTEHVSRLLYTYIHMHLLQMPFVLTLFKTLRYRISVLVLQPTQGQGYIPSHHLPFT